MTIEIVDIEKAKKINMSDELIGCLMEHVLRENGLGYSRRQGCSEKSTNWQDVCAFEESKAALPYRISFVSFFLDPHRLSHL